MTEREDARAAASVSIATLLLINKPVYPLYVWALMGADAATRSLATLALAPLYAAIPLVARRSGFWARVALPLAGLADTIYATKLMGPATGTEAFFPACLLLAIVCFSAAEARISRAFVIAVFAAFVVLRGGAGAPLQAWAADEASTLFTLNLYGGACLAAFIGLRFAAAK